MNMLCLRILIALISVAGFGVCAHGQTVDRISVKIPYEFVVSGKILPAGTYSVSRANESNGGTVLILSSFENRASMFVMPASLSQARRTECLCSSSRLASSSSSPRSRQGNIYLRFQSRRRKSWKAKLPRNPTWAQRRRQLRPETTKHFIHS